VSEAPSLGVLAGLLLVKEYATYVKFHTGYRIEYILLPNHRASHEASLTIQTFMIDKCDIRTKEKGHSVGFLYF
jgi:hypothetical protein